MLSDPRDDMRQGFHTKRRYWFFFFLMSIFFLNHLIIGLHLEVNWEHFEGMTLILSNFLFLISQRVLGEKSKSSSKITKIKQNNKNRLSLENKKTRHFL